MKKKLFVMLLAILTIPTHLFAYTDGQIVKFGDMTYKVISASANTLCFLGCDDSKSGELNIPAIVFDGKDVTFYVTEIGGEDAYGCKNITSVKIPEGVVKLNWSSFNNASLETVTLPKTVKTIKPGFGVFQKKAPKYVVDDANTDFCNDADGALYSKDKSKLYQVPSSLNKTAYIVDENVRTIHLNAFHNITGLAKITFPKDLQAIDLGFPTITDTDDVTEFAVAEGGTTTFKVIEGVLFDGEKLMDYPRAKAEVNYKVPDGIKEIVTYAIFKSTYMTTVEMNQVEHLKEGSFSNDYKLTSVTLPKNLVAETYLEGAFENCVNIQEYKVADECLNFAAQDGVIYSKDMTKLYFYPPAREGVTYDIPSSVTSIKAKAFQGSKFLETMKVPKGVTELGQECFRSMQKLTKVEFEETSTIQKFGTWIFRFSHLLKEVTLPSSLVELDKVFQQCNGLEIVNVPNDSKLKEIKKMAFVATPNLKAFNFLGSCELATIGENAFANCTQLNTFYFPKSVTSIGRNAFSGCNSMSHVTFAPDAAIVSFGEGSFADCGLVSIDIPKKVSEIKREAFRNCNVLTEVSVPSITTLVSPEAFKFCNKLVDIKVDKGNSKYSSIDGILLTKDKQTLVLFPPGKANDHFTLLPPSITKIGEYAFYECTALKNVTIPNKVTSIDKRAFGLCKNLNTITFLCDAMINPANIAQGMNLMAFDDGTQAASMFPNIDIHVRKDLETQYKAENFYKKFKSISPSFIDGEEEYIPVSTTDVDLLSTTTTDYTYIIPQKTSDGRYNVSLIGDYLFQKVGAEVKEVVIKDNVKYIGAKAFLTNITANTSTVENVFFIETEPTNDMLSTTRFELDETETNYNEFASTTKIYVKKSALNTYKTVWKKTVYDTATSTEKPSPFDFTSQIGYKIPDVKIAAKYGTFAREFDTDFSEYFTERGNTEVAAFVAGSNILPGGGDYGTSTYHVKMHSIDVQGGVNGNYGYVPAGTGVLLKVLDRDDTAADFYYTIGEKDDVVYNVTDNIMHGVTVRNAKVEASATDPVYVMQGGVFRKAETAINSFPVHRAYMKTGALPAGAKIVLVFDGEGGSATGIEAVTGSDASNIDNVYHNLNGQRVDNPQRGIYIRDGRKVIIK